MLWYAQCSKKILQRLRKKLKSYSYLLINLACIFIPFIASFYHKHSFVKRWKSFFVANSIVGLFFIIWDIIFTKMGVWGFNENYLTGINIINLPLEEVLFFFCIPYCCVFTYYAMTFLLKKDPFEKINDLLMWVFIGISIGMMILGYNQLYTFFTGLFTLLFLAWIKWRKIDFSYVFFSYFIILPFFFASNGLLTGSFLESPIVWYDDAQNFGIRMFTIPIEDSIYGFLLIAMNIVLFNSLE